MIHKGTITLETERLILRKFELSDSVAMFRNSLSDPKVPVYMTWKTYEDIDSVRNYIASVVDGYTSLNQYHWVIVVKELGEPIGSIGVTRYNNETRCVDIGYSIGSKWWHQNYTSEALNRLVRFFFEEVGANRIEAQHDTRNPNSGAVMRKVGMSYEGTFRQSEHNNQGLHDSAHYAILADDYFNPKPQSKPNPNTETVKLCTELMFHNMKIAMDTVNWNADVCGAPAWRYIYHTIHSADKWFINPGKRFEEPEPPFHTPKLDWPDTPSDTVLSREMICGYYEQVREKILCYFDGLDDMALSEIPDGCKSTRLGLIMSQFRHMYTHIGILNGVTIAGTGQYPRVINEGTYRSGKLPDGLYDDEVR